MRFFSFLSILQDSSALPSTTIDTLQLDTSTVFAPSFDTISSDSADAIGAISRDIGDSARLFMSGEWGQLSDHLYEGTTYLVIQFVPSLIAALLVLLLLYVIYRVFRKVLTKGLRHSKRVDSGLENLILKTLTVAAWLLIGMMVLAQFGVNVTALLAGLSIAGIAVGFAAKDTLENFISGVTIMLDKPFRVGDNVEVDGVFGTADEITLRSTRLRTLNNEIMVMPNMLMINQKLINHTMLGLLRVEIPFSIAYKEYPQEARTVVLQCTAGDERLDPKYPPTAVVTGLNDSSVDMLLRLYLKDPLEEVSVRFEYIEKVREALRSADIEIPFPHRQLFLDEAKAFDKPLLVQASHPDASLDTPAA